MFGLSLAVPNVATLSKGGWWNTAAYRAVDMADSVSKGPAAIADFRRWRFAIPVLASGSIAGATTAQLLALRPATFAEWFAFTSAGGTYIDASGTLQTAGANTPRRDWTNGAGQLMLNNASNNLITNTTSWPFVSGNAVYTSNAGTLLGKPASTIRQRPAAYGSTYQSAFVQPSANASTTYTRSVYLKSDGQRWVYIQQYHGTTNYGAYFDLQAGVKGTVDAGITADIVPCGGGVYRCSVTNTTGGSATYERLQIALVPGNGGNPVYVGDGVSGIYAALPQLEASAFATPPIETTGSSATRAIETCQLGVVPTALLQRSVATVVVRGRGLGTLIYKRFLSATAQNNAGLQRGGSDTLIGSGSSASTPVPYFEASLGTGAFAAGFGVAQAHDAAGRYLCGNGGVVTTGGTPGIAWADAWLGADGWYDEIVIYPFRVSNASLPSVARVWQ